MEKKPIETLPEHMKDGRWFIVWSHGAPECGRYNPVTANRYIEEEDGRYKKEEYIIYEWEGFNNFNDATHWAELPE